MRTVAWKVEVDGIQYMVLAMTEASAVRKALTEHRSETHGGQQLRLGQGSTTIVYCRSHRRELNKWLHENKKVLK